MKFPSCVKAIVWVAMLFISIIPALLAGDGALSPEMINQIQSSFKMDTETRAMYNAITNNNIDNLALNRDILQRHNDVFSHKIKAKGITNQKSSGRCWLFAGLNVMRPAIMEKYKLNNFEFSQNYLAFWDKMEKSNCFLERIIEFRDRDPLDREMEIILRDPFPDGGWWQYVVALIEKYGVVPKEVMPETNSSENTSNMNGIISQKLRGDAVKLRSLAKEGRAVEELRAEKTKMLAEVYRMLAMNLGEPPAEFPYRFENRDSVISELRTYTPKNFYEQFVGDDLNQYVSIFNDPTKENGKHYQISMSRNIFDGNDVDYANVDIAAMKEIAAKSVLKDEPVWFAADVGQDQSRKNGIMAMNIYDYGTIYNTDLGLTKEQRVMYRESAPNHAMVFVGVDLKNDKPVKWWVENSWGADAGSGGYWTMYDSWFDNHVYNIIVKKDFVPDQILAIYKEKPTVLPPWDPMYSLIR